MKRNLLTVSAVSAIAMVMGAMLIPSAANASDRIRYRCDANGASDISMNAKYELRNVRRKFSAEFEAAPGLGYTAGQQLNVKVDGVKVGSVTLESVFGGDVVGDLNFDTRPQPPDSIAFPGNWPSGVGKGSTVSILSGTQTILGCRLN